VEGAAALNSVCMREEPIREAPAGEPQYQLYDMGGPYADALRSQVVIGSPLAGVVSRSDWPEVLAVVSAADSGAASWLWPHSIYHHDGSGLLKTIAY
jgi:hypothetical protein